ncbi:hypothetical protein D3C80_1827910 [compost metagenome]
MADIAGGRRFWQQLATQAENAQGGVVHALVQFRPEDLVGRGFRPDLAALHQLRGGHVGGQGVGLGVQPGAHHRLANSRILIRLLAVVLIQLHQAPCGFLEARR